MPLDPLQERIARTALALPDARTLALAGGAAMIVHGFVNRETKDVDLFTEVDDHEAVQVAAALRRALDVPGLGHEGCRTATPSTTDSSRPTPAMDGSARSRSSRTEVGSTNASPSRPSSYHVDEACGCGRPGEICLDLAEAVGEGAGVAVAFADRA
jgi:hypothetical protein